MAQQTVLAALGGRRKRTGIQLNRDREALVITVFCFVLCEEETDLRMG